MEFTIILAKDTPYGTIYHANLDELDTRFETVVESFAQLIKKTLSNFQFNIKEYRFFLLDTSNPFISPPCVEIKDLKMKLRQVEYPVFDLYISTEEPQFDCPTDFAVNPTTTLTEEDPLEVLIHDGIMLIEGKEYHNAIKVLQEARDGLPEDPRPIQYITEVLLLLHKYKPALTLISSHIHSFPTNTKLQILNSKTLYKNGLYEQSLNVINSIQFVKDEKDKIEIYVLQVKNLIKLSRFDEANTLIQLVKKYSETNIKMAKLIARMYLTQGNLLDAVRLMISSCVYNPNYEDFQKFIGKYITNYKSSAILFNEMYDCFSDPNQMFFLAKTFYDYGRCDQADSCFVQAFMMQTKSAAMALMLVKNYVAKLLPPMRVIEVINIFLYESAPLASFILGEKCHNIDHLIGLPLKSDFDKTNAKKDSEKVKPYVKGMIEPPLSTSQLETIEIFMIIQIYLFINGYITQSEKILPSSIYDFCLTKTIISDTSRASIILSCFSRTIPRPLPCLKPIYLFGYETIVPISYRTINFRGEKMILQPVMIEGLNYTTFGKRRNAPYFEFSRRMNLVPEYSTIIFEFGREDCKKAIVEANKLIAFSTRNDAFMQPISYLVNGIKKLRKNRKIRILIHPVMATNNRTHFQVIEFNNLLKENIEKLAETIDEVQFIDILDKCLKEDKQLKDEFYFNKTTWDANYLPLVEEFLNKNLPKNPFPQNIAPAQPIVPDFE